MGGNLDLSVQLFKKGAIIFIPSVSFKTGVTKPKYAVLLEDANILYKKETITACLTTSRKFKRLKSWFVITSAEILGKSKNEQTTIDCLNRISLRANQIKKCVFINHLSDDLMEALEEAHKYAEFYLGTANKTL